MRWKVNQKVTIRDSYDSYSGYYTDYIYFEIEGKKMYLYEDGYGDYLEWVLTKGASF